MIINSLGSNKNDGRSDVAWYVLCFLKENHYKNTMAKKESKPKTTKTGKSRAKQPRKEMRENDLESGDNPDERERSSGDNSDN